MIGELLRLYIAANDIGMREMGTELGMSAATVSRITRGLSMDAATMLKLITWLFGTSAGNRGRKLGERITPRKDP